MKTLTSKAFEWPTLILLVITYLLWAGLTIYADSLGAVITLLLLTPLLTFHSSLQHETLHMIEPRWKLWGFLSVFPAVGLFVPYIRFRDTHLQHHINENLTDPYYDPETAYWVKEVWVTLPRWLKGLLIFNNTLLGRMLIGPLIGQITFMRMDWLAIKAGDKKVLWGWLAHIPAVALVLIWLIWFASISLWTYLIACYFGLSILKIRTYLEHRAHDNPDYRSVIIQDNGVLAFLFLNNNLHAVHHIHPNIAWYNLPAVFYANQEQYLRGNGGYVYRDYWQIFKAYFFKTKEFVEHPLWSLENRSVR